MGRGDIFPKNAFHWGKNFVDQIYREFVLRGRGGGEEGTNDQGKEFHKMYFPVI